MSGDVFSSPGLEGTMVAKRGMKKGCKTLQATQSRSQMCDKGIIQSSKIKGYLKIQSVYSVQCGVIWVHQSD